jgi:potassium-transporting ATPase potassium-binding subunit
MFQFQVWFLPLLILVVTTAVAIPLSRYLAWIMDGRYRAPQWLSWIERRVDTGPQSWKQYAIAMLLFNTVMFVFGFVVLALQAQLPLNPDDKHMLAPTTIFNTVCSFLTNTNLQHYSGEQHLSYVSQLLVICWYMFVSASVGFCCLTAIIRALRSEPTMGNFYLDMWRVVAYMFVPAALVMGVLLMVDGVPMTFDGTAQVATVEPGAMGPDANGQPQLQQPIARGPVAAVLPIKHLGTNGGGFFGANSSHPYENPSALSNLLEIMNFCIFPFALVLMFGRMLRNMRHAWVIFGVMMVLMLTMIGWGVYWDTLNPNPGLAGLPVDQNLGNLEGKELRFGTSAGPTFAACTTAITCGSVNCMHDSLNPLAGITPLTGMWLNCVFGGKGVGMINLLLYLIVGVFIAGLMVGRTPEYLGKKVEAREMKLAMIALLAHPILILVPTGLFAATDWGNKATNNPGAHGFSEILYEFSSSSANNGSGFEGLGDTYGANDNPNPAPESPPWDIAAGLVMLLGRFIPVIAPLAFAAGLAQKKPTPFTVGTMRTDTFTFGCVLLGTIILVGALLFLPVAALGPVAEHLGPIPFGG